MKEPFMKVPRADMPDDEVRRIEEEVNAQVVLTNIRAPRELHDGVASDIEVYKNLSEQGKRAMRIGYETMAHEEKEKEETAIRFVKKRRRPRKRTYLLVAAMMIMVLAAGVTSVGGPVHLTRMVEEMFVGRSQVKIDSQNSDIEVASSDEEKAYQQIKDELGVETARMYYLPDDAKFEIVHIDKEMQVAMMRYHWKDSAITCHLAMNYREGVFGLDIEDTLVDQYDKHVEAVKMEIKEYRIESTGQAEFTAQFDVNNVKYFFVGIMEKEEFNKIMDGLRIF